MNTECVVESEEIFETDKARPAGKIHKKNPKLSLSNWCCFFDFDNTVTPFDVIDDIVERFSINEKWRKIEKDWKQGKIGSRECLEGQFNEVRVGKNDFIRYLSEIKIDKYFSKILALLKRRRVFAAIVSDSSSFIIGNILKNNGIKELRCIQTGCVLKNRMVLNFLISEYCPKCANCKKSHLRKSAIRDKIFIYVGGGLSISAPPKCADIVFAKASLLKYSGNITENVSNSIPWKRYIIT